VNGEVKGATLRELLLFKKGYDDGFTYRGKFRKSNYATWTFDGTLNCGQSQFGLDVELIKT